MSSPWPNLNIHDKDAEAFQNWCLGVFKSSRRIATSRTMRILRHGVRKCKQDELK